MESALPPIKPDPREERELKSQIMWALRTQIYLPLMELLDLQSIHNSPKDRLQEALRQGSITFHRGRFKGRLSSSITKELKKLGAVWDNGSFKIRLSELPGNIQSTIAASEARFMRTAQSINERLAAVSPEEIAERISASRTFDAAIWRVDRTFRQQMRGISVMPTLSKGARQRIAKDYTENLRTYVADFTRDEMLRLRKQVEQSTLKGLRYETMAKTIRRSYGVSERKAMFLARQETNLLVSKIKEARYQAAGIEKYRWECVKGSPKHPVRPMHKRLDGKVFSWDKPPVVNERGERKHPGEDFNCRCVARPIVKF